MRSGCLSPTSQLNIAATSRCSMVVDAFPFGGAIQIVSRTETFVTNKANERDPMEFSRR